MPPKPTLCEEACRAVGLFFLAFLARRSVMHTNMRESMVMRSLVVRHETQLDCAKFVRGNRQTLALSQVRRQQPQANWRADHALGGKPKGKPAGLAIDPRASGAGRLLRLLGVSERCLAYTARHAVLSGRYHEPKLVALANGRSANSELSRTTGFGSAIRRAG
jgi:hypothetical protein